ncbi:PP2C family protein-serine/threonine phosphatase [Nocardioides alcanivorans]|uniref:PP2C family protein-serine/threonine phosphatase n=1 Tax=Nocardioides alcanivorans TaxID=2897352 RepID=UPI001F411AF6|nr:protein phosphatase 2C domain-containing protein [Nocardioides alcanivorans]
MTTDAPSSPGLRLRYSALSDVGRVRKDNQDSGYAGPWLLAVCDGVGGAARGDIASSTAIQQIRRIDQRPTGDDLIGLVAGALHRAHDRISELVDADTSLTGTSTTATLALFDGQQLTIGHVGDSRAYLVRAGTISQLTHDHTFVQSLIDEGRITEAEARTHPHRNLILRAVDGVHDTEPDLFTLELAEGDRIMLCSDGASGSLEDERLLDILSTGTPDYATVELVRASLEAGSTDNVTCVVADVVGPEDEASADGPDTGDGSESAPSTTPLLVGAAAELPRRGLGQMASRFLGHRNGDTGEIEPVPAEVPEHAFLNDPIDPEVARYAPRPPGRFLWLKAIGVLAVLVGMVWAAGAAMWAASQQQYYVSVKDDRITIFRGVDYDVPFVSLSTAVETYDATVDSMCEFEAESLREGIEAANLQAAQRKVQELITENTCADDDLGNGTRRGTEGSQ